jgi:hypothetical protein
MLGELGLAAVLRVPGRSPPAVEPLTAVLAKAPARNAVAALTELVKIFDAEEPWRSLHATLLESVLTRLAAEPVPAMLAKTGSGVSSRLAFMRTLCYGHKKLAEHRCAGSAAAGLRVVERLVRDVGRDSAGENWDPADPPAAVQGWPEEAPLLIDMIARLAEMKSEVVNENAATLARVLRKLDYSGRVREQQNAVVIALRLAMSSSDTVAYAVAWSLANVCPSVMHAVAKNLASSVAKGIRQAQIPLDLLDLHKPSSFASRLSFRSNSFADEVIALHVLLWVRVRKHFKACVQPELPPK